MYVDSITIENLRTFEAAKVRLLTPEKPEQRRLPNVNLLLGNNGTGKSTILRAVAMATLSPVLAAGSGFVPYSLVRRTSSQDPALHAALGAAITLHRDDVKKPAKLVANTRLHVLSGNHDKLVPDKTLMRWEKAMFDEDSAGFLVVGYGVSRRTEPASGVNETLRSKSRAVRYQRVATMFEDEATLMPLSAWLPRWPGRGPGCTRQEVRELLQELLPGEIRLLPEPVDGEYHFEFNGHGHPFPALSDGYRAYISWIADLVYHLSMSCPPGTGLRDRRGVVLVDELGLHLHPEWQRRVVSTICRALPKLQFIFSTHSPIIAGSVEAANVHVLTAREDGSSEVVPLEDEIYGLSADQILTSPLFGLRTTRNPEFYGRLAEASRAAVKGDLDASLRFTRMVAHGAAAENELDDAGALPAELPAWVHLAESLLDEGPPRSGQTGTLGSGAEDRANAVPKVAKKKVAKKKVAKKKVSKKKVAKKKRANGRNRK